MLTDQFLNLCCVLLVDDNPKVTHTIIRDISQILNSYKPETLALSFRKKFELSKVLAKLRIDQIPIDKIIDSIVVAGQFSDLDDFVKSLPQRKIAEEKLTTALDQVLSRKQYLGIVQDLSILEDFSKKFSSNAFPETGEAIQGWDKTITQLHSRILEDKRKQSRSNIKEIDLYSDPYEDVLKQIEVSYSGKNAISSGYWELDNYLNGGFEPTRLYIFGGISGDGKSVLLNNFVINAVEKIKPSPSDPLNVFVYFTLENLIDESLVRLYCCKKEKTIKDLIREYPTERMLIEREFKTWLTEHNSAICMMYFPPTFTSVSELISTVDLVKARYGEKAVIRAIYVDYLDLLKSGQTFDLHRLEMGQVTIDLKVAAVMMGIPVVTVTQLNRGAYDPKQELSLAQMSESLKKVEHSDFVGIIRTELDEQDVKDVKTATTMGLNDKKSKMRIVIGKNRSGPKNVSFLLKTKFSMFKVYNDKENASLPWETPHEINNENCCF